MPLPPKKERREVIGPILHFRGVQGERWRVSALFVLNGAAEPPDMTADGVMLPVPPRHVASLGKRHVWRWEFAVPRGDEETRVGFGFRDGGRWYMTVPAKAEMPRIAYTACNGTEDEDSLQPAEPAAQRPLGTPERSAPGPAIPPAASWRRPALRRRVVERVPVAQGLERPARA